MTRKTYLQLLSIFFALAMPLFASAPSFLTPGRTDELALIFRPFETDQVTLSPNGRRLAYTEREGERLHLVIRDLEANTRNRLHLADAEAAPLSAARERTPARLTFLQWATADRLVFNLNGRNVWSIRADGEDPRRLGDSRDYAVGAPSGGVRSLSVGIAALPRGSRYVYLEGQMVRANIGEKMPRTPEAAQAHPLHQPITRTLGMMDPPDIKRVVFRVDVNTGSQTEFAEAPQSSFLFVDRQGYPRVARSRVNSLNRQNLTERFVYAEQKRSHWRPLDQVLGPDNALDFTASPGNRFGERSIPLGFAHDPNVLYFTSNVGRDTFGIYALDLKAGRRTDVAIETPKADLIDQTANDYSRTLVFDDWRRQLVGVRYLGLEREALWLDSDLRNVDHVLRASLPGKSVEIIEWDESRRYFLLLASSGADPGIYYVYDRTSNRLDEIMNRAPWLPRLARNPTASIGWKTPEGVALTGYLTLPQHSRLKRPPLIVLCHDGPVSRDYPDYHRGAQALAAMGFAVVRVNYRGSVGFGRKHLDAGRSSPDAAPVADIMDAVRLVVESGKVDPRFVAIMGGGHGGYLAMRALQLHPKSFRCAVTLDAPMSLATWVNTLAMNAEVASNESVSAALDTSSLEAVDQPAAATLAVAPETAPLPTAESVNPERDYFGHSARQLEEASPLHRPEEIVSPVLVIQSARNFRARGRDLTAALQKLGRPATFVSLSESESSSLPQAQAALYARIYEFLNENVYDYAVKLGETVEIDSFAPPTSAP